MAAHQFTIEKAKFSAALLKPDFTIITRDQTTVILELLDNTITRCTPSNIQSCKAWLLSNVVPSSTKTGALGKYLLFLAKAQDASRITHGDERSFTSATSRTPLHALYLLNDLLHHTRYHASHPSLFSTFSSSIQPFVLDLVQLASVPNRPKVRARVNSLLQVWQEEAYFGGDYVKKLREAATNSATSATNDQFLDHAASFNPVTSVKEQPYVMPASHGDPSTPYHDLPAGNMMPHIMPNKSVPIRPDDIRALKFAPGPADDSLVVAVKDFMTAVDKIDNYVLDDPNAEGIVEDIDELGQPLLLDENGELLAGLTYYGWSREFCEKMKGRGSRKDARPGRERSYSSSRSRSRSPRKRRRYSNSASSSASYSRSRSRNRSSNNNFRKSRQEYGQTDLRHNEDRSLSRPRSNSSNFQATHQTWTHPSSSNAPINQSTSQHTGTPAYPLPEVIPPPPPMSNSNVDFNQHAFLQFPAGLGNLPVIPPLPTNYPGPWALTPAPPPPPLSNMAFNIQPGMQPYRGPRGFPMPPSYNGKNQPYGGSDQNRWSR